MFMQDITLENLFDQFNAAQKNDDIDAELEILRQLLSLAQQRVNTTAEIELLRLLGNIYQTKGLMRDAHSYRLVAAKLAENPASECPNEIKMMVYGDLGRSYIESDGWINAEIYTQQALDLANSLHHQQGQCIYKINLELIYGNTGHMQQAHQLAEEVFKTAEPLHDHTILGLQYLNLAKFSLSEARLNESQDYARKTLAHAELIPDKHMRTQALDILGASFGMGRLVTGRPEYFADAEHYFRQTVEHAQTSNSASLEAATELQWAGLYEGCRQYTEAVTHYQRALEVLESVRSTLGYEEFQQTYFQSFQPTYERVTELLLRRELPAQAFLATEQLRSRLLLSLLGPGQSNTHLWVANRRDELREILNLYGHAVIDQCFNNEAQALLRSVTVGLRGKGGTEETADTPLLREARQHFLRLYDAERSSWTNWYQEQSPPPIKIEEGQKFLGPDDALLSYLITERSVIIFVATNQSLHFQHLTYSRKSLAKDIAELCEAMNNVQQTVLDDFIFPGWNARKELRDPWPEEVHAAMEKVHRHLEKLYALLIAPVLSAIEHKTHWVIVPHGPLHLLPWAALRSGGHYLIEQHSLSLLPSASIGAVLAARASVPKGDAVFFADPDNENKRLKLPAAQEEVRASYDVFRTGPPPFIGSTATKDALLKHTPTAKLLHLSCHHLFDARVPFLSFLKLAGTSGADFLYMLEVAELKLAAELVSLSACNSAHSQIASGDEQYGIVRAFLAAGARSVISTLWSVEDRSASIFFTDFYQRVLSNGLAQALRMAQLRLLADPRYELPNFWAAYVLSGQWDHSLSF